MTATKEERAEIEQRVNNTNMLNEIQRDLAAYRKELKDHIEHEEDMMKPWWKGKINLSIVGAAVVMAYTWNIKAVDFVRQSQSDSEAIVGMSAQITHMTNEFDGFKDTVTNHIQSDLEFREKVLAR